MFTQPLWPVIWAFLVACLILAAVASCATVLGISRHPMASSVRQHTTACLVLLPVSLLGATVQLLGVSYLLLTILCGPLIIAAAGLVLLLPRRVVGRGGRVTITPTADGVEIEEVHWVALGYPRRPLRWGLTLLAAELILAMSAWHPATPTYPVPVWGRLIEIIFWVGVCYLVASHILVVAYRRQPNPAD